MTLRSLLINATVAAVALVTGAVMSTVLYMAGMPAVGLAITAVLVGSAVVLVGGLLVRRGVEAEPETPADATEEVSA